MRPRDYEAQPAMALEEVQEGHTGTKGWLTDLDGPRKEVSERQTWSIPSDVEDGYHQYSGWGGTHVGNEDKDMTHRARDLLVPY
jgi:hypothetical protein